MKRCPRCKQDLPLDSFHRSTRSADGLQSACKDCQNEARRVRLAAKRAAIQESLTESRSEKRCPRCETVLPLTVFHRNARMKDGLQTYCKECSKAHKREYETRHADVIAAKRAERQLRGSGRTEGEKTCTRCGESKPLIQFYIHRGTRDGRATHCAECQRARSRAWTAANRERVKDRNAAARLEKGPVSRSEDHRQWWLRTMYGLDQAEYEQLLARQGGVCAICGDPEGVVDPRWGRVRRLSVDHSHKTGKVRGLLCGHCNRGIGQFADDHERLTRAAAYLREAVAD